jgi:hypothetical protein
MGEFRTVALDCVGVSAQVSGSVAGVWARRSGDTADGEGAVVHWPGKGHGVREPFPQETALSWGEVLHGVREGLIAPPRARAHFGENHG